MQTYSVVENPGFKHLIGVLEICYEMPSKSLPQKVLPIVYDFFWQKKKVWAVQI